MTANLPLSDMLHMAKNRLEEGGILGFRGSICGNSRLRWMVTLLGILLGVFGAMKA